LLSFDAVRCLQPLRRNGDRHEALTTYEEFCLKNAAHFVAARGRTPATRTREQFATLPEAQAFGAAIGDGRTMIYAVTTLGHSAHITNA
jgi:hypothetical protein